MLALSEVHAFYDLHHILHGVSLTVSRGEILAVLGRNGAGKTTMLRAIMGLVPRCEGAITYNGASLVGLEPHVINRLGLAYVPENRGIFSGLTTDENLQIAAQKQTDWTIESVFELFPSLKELRERKGGHLSGGEQQMLAIGRALMTNPRLLILDEATEGLAPMVRAEIWHCLENLKEEAQAILVIDKNVDALTRIADRHYIVEKGAVVWTGTSEELRADEGIQHQYLGV